MASKKTPDQTAVKIYTTNSLFHALTFCANEGLRSRGAKKQFNKVKKFIKKTDETVLPPGTKIPENVTRVIMVQSSRGDFKLTSVEYSHKQTIVIQNV